MEKLKKIKLANGQTVQENDIVRFVNSDKKLCVGRVKRNKNKLYFWNIDKDITCYRNAYKVKNIIN